MNGAKPISQKDHEIVKHQFNRLRDKCMYVLGRSVGFRISELLTIRINDVYNKDYLKIQRKSMKGQTQSREIPLTNEAKEAIKEYLDSIGSIDFMAPLFISRKGDKQALSRSQAHRILKAAFLNAGLQGSYSTHSMRKSFSLNIYEKSGHDLVLTQRSLGHANINTTIKYLPVDQEKLNKIILGE